MRKHSKSQENNDQIEPKISQATNSKQFNQRSFRHGRSLLTLATIGLVAQTFSSTQALSTRHDQKLGDSVIYNPYVVESYFNDEWELRGHAVSTQAYNPDQHARALRYLSQGLKDNHDLDIDPHKIPEGINNKFISNVSFSFGMNDYKIGMLTITDANTENQRYSIADWVLEKPGVQSTMRLEILGFQIYQNPLSFSFTDLRDSNNVFLHTNDSSFVFMDKYIQMDLQLPSQRVFGLGERYHEFALGEGTWTMWSRAPSDFANQGYDDGTGGKQGYGMHPFMLVQGKHAGDFFGVFFRNSNAQSPLLKFNDNGGSTLSYITTGGQLEIEFYFHGTAKQIIQQYMQKIGHPALPPFWSLGWGQSSYGYQTQAQVEDVIAKYAQAQIPLEHVWFDIPYMKKFNDFTVDTVAFPNLAQFSQNLHDKRIKLVVILDPGLQADPTNKYYNLAQNYKTLIQSTINPDSNQGAVTLASVNGGQDVFLDFFNDDSQHVWHEGLQDLFKQVEFDGLWLDMNEVSGYCSGECPTKPETEEEVLIKRYLREQSVAEQTQQQKDNEATTTWYDTFPQDQISTWFLPFVPGYANAGNLDSGISLNATHSTMKTTEYNLHGMFGMMQSRSTQQFLQDNGDYPNHEDRAFILSRSTFAGSGRFSSHWLGDNWRDWAHLKYSIAGIMNMNMFGIPHSGADVCGFYGQKLDQEMCTRWIQLAEFYPFARMHYNATFNGDPVEGTEPYNLQGAYLAMARHSIYSRYQYLRHMYTCLFEAKEDGQTCFDPLFFHYPEDENTFTNIEESFIVGQSLKISPILAAGVTDTYDSYFPAGRWVSMINFKEVIEGGKVVQLKTRNTCNVHLRPGKMIPFQNNSDHSISVTDQLIETPISIIANRDKDGGATGSLLLDTGRSRRELDEGKFEYYSLVLQAKTFHKYIKHGNHATQKQFFDRLVIVDAEDLKDTDFACIINHRFEIINLNIAYDADVKSLNITVPQDQLQYFYNIRQISFGDSKKDLNLCGDTTYHYSLKDAKLPDLSSNIAKFQITHDAKLLPDLNVTLRVLESNTVNVKWTFDKTPDDWRIPFEVPDDIIDVKNTERPYSQLSDYLRVSNKPSFQIEILNRYNNTVYTIHELFLHSYLNYIGSTLNTTKGDDWHGMFGLGERAQRNLFYEDGVYNIWNHDAGMPFDDGRPSSKSLYGNHPFYMYKNADSIWVGVFHNLVANTDYFIKNDQVQGHINVTQLAVGGVGDLFFIVDIDPISVISGYQGIVGKPVVIPQWALGWHQCRWGYKDTEELRWVVQNYTEANIPLDVQWSDIDYMYNYRDFSFDPQRYKNLHQFVDDLHNEKNMRYVPIIDAGIAVRPWGHYPVYDFAIEKKVFMKINDGQTFIGQVWPNDAAYPDFFNPNTQPWWEQELTYFHDTIAIDGLWLDMNEASNFCSGVCYPDQNVDFPEKHNLKYTPGNRDIEDKAIPMDVYHQNGYKQIDTHSLFGTMQSKATHQWFQENGNRTFIISRSSTAGHGKFASRWLGDNDANQDFMGQSVTGVMMQNMFGIPFVGSDICGFGGNTNAELCARWHAVGGFQPFSRNHNAIGNQPQEPHIYADLYYEPGISYLDIMRQAMRTKYSLIRYSYTQLMMMSLYGGSPVYKPVFFDYPNDKMAYQDQENNVILGKSLKLSILSNRVDVNSTDFYFPAGKWCNVLNYTEPCFSTATGISQTRRTKAYDYYLHLKEGHIIPFQDASFYNANTTVDLQKKPVELHISGKTDTWSGTAWQAYGHYYNDDGLALDLAGNNNQYTIYAAQTPIQGTTKIQIQISTQQAYNYDKKDKTMCTAINGNDYVDTIRIYDATNLGAINNFHLSVTFVNGTKSTNLGDAALDKKTGQLIYKAPQPLCLSAIALFTFTKLS